MKTMNILHINGAGITDRFYDIFFEQIRKTEDSIQDIYIAYNRSDYKDEEIARLSMYYENINPILSPIKNNIDRFMYFNKIRKYSDDLEMKTEIKKYEIIHAHSLFTDGGVAYIINKRYGIPYIVSVRITDINIFMKYFLHLKLFMEMILSNASQVVFLNPSLQKSLYKKIINSKYKRSIELKSKVLPNGINNFWLENAYYAYYKSRNNPIHLIQVGKLTKAKNTKTTIYALRELKKRKIDATLDVVGTGPELKRLEKLVYKLGLKKSVKFHGFINNKENLLRLYREADIFVLPSYAETFGIVYIEAMSQGLPVIYTKGQGIDGYFEKGEVGFPIDPFSPKEICDAIIEINSNYDQISKRCTELVCKFNWIDIAREYHQLYEMYKKGNQ